MSQRTTTPRLNSAMPGFAVRDLEAAISFYTEKLGFRVSFRNGRVFAIVRRDAVEIGLKLDRTGDESGKGSAYAKVTGVDGIYSELSAKGVAMTHELRNENYGMREFMITDPDGNTLNFGEPIPSAGATDTISCVT